MSLFKIPAWVIEPGMICELVEWDETISRIVIGRCSSKGVEIKYCDNTKHLVRMDYLRPRIINKLGYEYSPITVLGR